MRDSLRQLRTRRNLKGCVVLLDSKHADLVPLALNFGPSIIGPAWGFDSLGRATVFKNRKQAWQVVKKHFSEDKIKRVQYVQLKHIATLIPEVNSKMEVFYRAEPTAYLKTLKERVERLAGYAQNLEKDAKKKFKQANKIRRKAMIMACLNSKY